ncbi:unannotated protein [freshwater metagenome]|uniref:Unannotated protein n=1 Tax=freshwater metagenome TaxID=449393 RepID=A0A6J7H2G2_9ZZZZ|nr:glycosyltransferase [Actinomycetota bacterium]
MTSGHDLSLRARLGALALKADPDFYQRKWRKAQGLAAQTSLGAPAYASLIARPSIDTGAGTRLNRPVHVVVVPYEGEGHESFTAGTRNFYYEAAQTLTENLGQSHVSFFSVRDGESPADWHVRLADYVFEVGATHVITHIEADPGSAEDSWTWDVWWTAMAPRWNGVLLGVMFDSAFEWIRAKSRLLARISPNFMAVDICMPMNGELVRGRNEVGPVNMPVSRQSLALVEERLASVEVTHDVSFIGALYPYRVEMLDQLRSAGIRVAVNPHRSDETADFAASRTNQPSWLDYMAGLAGSHMTINFSRSSAGPFEQLKTRVLEATLAGTVLLTDDQKRTKLFFEPDFEFLNFNSVEELPALITGLLSDPVRLASIKKSGKERAYSLAHTNFWGGIEAGLRDRKLPLLQDSAR